MSEIESKPFEEEAELEATPVAEPTQEAEIQEVEIDALVEEELEEDDFIPEEEEEAEAHRLRLQFRPFQDYENRQAQDGDVASEPYCSQLTVSFR